MTARPANCLAASLLELQPKTGPAETARPERRGSLMMIMADTEMQGNVTCSLPTRSPQRIHNAYNRWTRWLRTTKVIFTPSASHRPAGPSA